MCEKDFFRVKNEYTCLREKERRKIIECLVSKKDRNGKSLFFKKKGIEYCNSNKYRGGSGESNYTSGGTLEGKYDLSNFKYIETRYKDCNILISLQSFDIDPNSGNIHLLFDRIGIIYDYDSNSKVKIEYDFAGLATPKISDALIKMKTTKWELPLTCEHREELVNEIINHIDIMRES